MDQPAQKDTTFAPAGGGQSPPASTAGQIVQSQKPTSEQPRFNKLPFMLAAIVAILLLAVLLTLGVINQKKITPQPSASPTIYGGIIPEKNLNSANGEVIAVSPEEGKLSLRSLTPRSDGGLITWNVTVTNDTILAKFDDWAKASSGESTLGAGLSKTPEEIKVGLARIKLSDFKAGDSVYLMTKQEQDLATQTDIEGPNALLLQ